MQHRARELKKYLARKGIVVHGIEHATSDGHYRLTLEDGTVVPAAYSPSDRRNNENLVRLIRRIQRGSR